MKSAIHGTTLHMLGGPAVFLILVLLPLHAVPLPVRASLGLLVWMSWWWIAQPVHLAVTGFLPLVVLALFDFLPVGSILPAYAQQLVILLIGANILASLWKRWGLDRRIALVSLLGAGTNTRRQILVWFVVSVVLSSFLPNTVVAAAMMPIVVAMLRFINIEDIGKSAFGTAVLIAVAWGTSVGGAATPMGGAPNLLTVQFLETQLLDHEFLFTTWVTRLLPLTALLALVSFIFMRFAFKPEIDHVEGTRTYFNQELRALGKMSVPEKWGVFFFVAATLLAFSRQRLLRTSSRVDARLCLSDFRYPQLYDPPQGRAITALGLRPKTHDMGLDLFVCRRLGSRPSPERYRNRAIFGRTLNSLCRRWRLCGNCRVCLPHCGAHTDHQQHGCYRYCRADYDQYFREPRPKSDSLCLYRRRCRKFRHHASFLRRRSGHRGRIWGQSENDVFLGSLADRADPHRDHWMRLSVGDLLAGLRRGMNANIPRRLLNWFSPSFGRRCGDNWVSYA